MIYVYILIYTYLYIHTYRGEFQYKVVKLDADKLMNNVGHLLPPHEFLYIATDEKNKTFFRPFKQRGFYNIRYLDDYMELAGLNDVNPNYLGKFF